MAEPPFDDPSFDSGGAHSVPKDYSVVGFALAARAGAPGPSSWADFFDLATTFPGQVGVPDDAVTVIGAALVATGHDWNSSASGDLDDALGYGLLTLEELADIPFWREGAERVRRLEDRAEHRLRERVHRRAVEKSVSLFTNPRQRKTDEAIVSIKAAHFVTRF